ncbi:predicted protein [Naegleria gruberi]|uniref:Predicted protein n=1 Tax=Naegleria gruberi TaxID=5762 RepID=D2W4M6_NAEGR|nr:uncharacterized protein NAEGRDRAFT_76360 [Naegleria gruberi]EFC35978.1 predicted protein [Naegleria gruberi]|eukprot:XP_002668722.1 predicted protein [Naegleria gruberi strain NEG-M]
MHPYHGSLPPLSPSNSTCSSKTSSSNCSTLSSPKEKITSPSHSSSYITASATYSSSPSPSSTTSGVATSSSPTTLIQPSSTASVNASTSNTTPETITSTPIISKETPKPTIEISKVSNTAPTTSSPISKDKLKRARPLSATKNPLVQSLTLEKFKDDLAIGRKSKSNIISDNSVKVPYSSSLTRSGKNH